ncbi:hypothetical protein [Flavobacterium sp.]|jgi:hypothetical protein|uniref:hypothetical protein n=1 Tax=Flavobacterium sp. TaxID=239 RepID=UPI002A7F05A3|nr:hypothetical protein [Flavobacterium sp.]
MKKITFLVAGILFLGINIAKASDRKVLTDDERRSRYHVDYRDAEPIVFLERGVEFYVFPNGEFDFNTVSNHYSANPRPRSGGINTTHGAPGVRSNYGPRDRGIRIEHDHMGRVRRVGNAFVNYDAYGRVKRIGNVYMRYNSFALTQVGGLRIIYNRRGHIIDIIGHVNYSSTHYNHNPRENGGHGNGNNYGDDDYGDNNDNDDDYYYYKKDGTKAKMSKDDIVEIKKK